MLSATVGFSQKGRDQQARERELMAEAKWYSVRIELINAKKGAWDDLHKKMWPRGFRRVITYEGKMYKLPTGSYVIQTTADMEAVRAAAQKLATAIHADSIVWAVRFIDFDFYLYPAAEDPDAPK